MFLARGGTLPGKVECDGEADIPRVPILGLHPSGVSTDVGPGPKGLFEECQSQCDSGVNLSFVSDTSSLRSNSLESHRCDSIIRGQIGRRLDSGVQPIPEQEKESTHKLNQQFEELRIQQEPSSKYPPLPSLASLRNRSIEEKLRDIEAVDLSSEDFDRPKSKPKPVCSPKLDLNNETEELPQAFKPDEDGDSALHLAIVHKREDVAGAIIESAPSWQVLSRQNVLGQSPLHLAVLTNQPHLCRQLLVSGALIDSRDRHGNTPLHLSAKVGYAECVAALTRAVTHQEVDAVQYAVPFQRIPQAQDMQNYEGETCLQLAAAGSHFSIMNHLVVQCGANVNGADWKSGRTVLHRAVEANNVSLVEFLLRHPRIDPDLKTYEGHTALQLALGRRHREIIQMLILVGADDAPLSSASSSDSSDSEDTPMASDDCDDGYDDFEFCGQAIALR